MPTIYYFTTVCPFLVVYVFLAHFGQLFSNRRSRRAVPVESHHHSTPRFQTLSQFNTNQHEPSTACLTDKRLFHQVQNPNDYPDVGEHTRNRLSQIFDEAVESGLCDSRSIFTIGAFTITKLRSFLLAQESSVLSAYESYLVRRRNGSPRELLCDHQYAKYWFQQTAPIRFVDGAWLGTIYGSTTTVADLKHSKPAWQIFSEELGDGTLAKNHVYIFSKLLKSIGVDLPDGDTVEFISSQKNNNSNAGIWLAAVTPLLIANQAQEHFPEILGFNLAYEIVSVTMLLAAYESRELGFDPTYFDLHNTIDNSVSGHTAMAEKIVVDYLEAIGSDTEREKYWRRIQAGFQLCQYTLAAPVRELPIEVNALKVLSAKIVPSRVIHESCTGQIGGRYGLRLAQWLKPQYWHVRKLDFLRSLSASHWIQPGCPDRSRLMTLLRWNGRMFGAFTDAEVDVLQNWIISLDPKMPSRRINTDNHYLVFTGRQYNQSARINFDGRVKNEKVVHIVPGLPIPARPCIDLRHLRDETLSVLLLISAIPLERVLCFPFQAATHVGAGVLLILRHIYNLEIPKHSVLGMDVFNEDRQPGVLEYALGMMQDQIHPHQSLEEIILSSEISKEWTWLMHRSRSPEKNLNFLIGAQLGFARGLYVDEEVHSILMSKYSLSQALISIGERVSKTVVDIVNTEDEDIRKGFWSVVEALKRTEGEAT